MRVNRAGLPDQATGNPDYADVADAGRAAKNGIRGVESPPIGSGNRASLRSPAIAGSNGGIARQVEDGRLTTCENLDSFAGGGVAAEGAPLAGCEFDPRTLTLVRPVTPHVDEDLTEMPRLPAPPEV